MTYELNGVKLYHNKRKEDGMTYSYNKLKGRIKEIFGTQGAFAESLGLSENSLSLKLNGKRGFSQEDIELWCDLLHIEYNQIGEYFFA